MKKINKWMNEAFKNAGKGLFHRQIGVPTTEKIPETFLQKIVATEIGKFAHNPTKTGKKMVKVTLQIKRRAVALLNADRGNK